MISVGAAGFVLIRPTVQSGFTWACPPFLSLYISLGGFKNI